MKNKKFSPLQQKLLQAYIHPYRNTLRNPVCLSNISSNHQDHHKQQVNLLAGADSYFKTFWEWLLSSDLLYLHWWK